jgi:hypothetical protein
MVATTPGTQVETLRNYVGGRWVAAEATETQEVRNPATDEPLARVPLSGGADVDAAVTAAAAAFPAWRATPPQERARHFFALRQILVDHRDELARLIVTEMGKTLDDAKGEVQRGIDNVETACGIPTLQMGYGLEDGAARGIDEEVVFQPIGPFAAVTPFNFPFMIAFWFWPYAVACGNTFILKPSEQDPLVMRRTFELIEQAGFPPGVINLVNGGKDAVNALLDHPGVKGISFVGASKTAAYVYARAAANGKRVQASGGAKNAIVVMPDANMDAYLSTIMNSFYGAAGQRCLANSLVLPVGAAHAEARERVAEAAAKIRLGDGLETGVDLGPVVSAAARDRIVPPSGPASPRAPRRSSTAATRACRSGRRATSSAQPCSTGCGPRWASTRGDLRPGRRHEPGRQPGRGDRPDQRRRLRQRGLDLHRERGRRSQVPLRGRDGQRRDQRRGGRPGRLLPVQRRQAVVLRLAPPPGRDAVRFYTQSKVVITRWTGSDGSPVSGVGR